MSVQSQRDYYEVLGVSQNATEEEIENSYRNVVRGIRDAGGVMICEKLIEANRAHAVLADPAKRARYDKFGGDRLDGGVSGKRNYYEALGIDRTAAAEEIQSSYLKRIAEIRKLGGPTAIDRLLQANRARTVLMDPAKRKLYDQFGHTAVENASPSFQGFEERLAANEKLRRELDEIDELVEIGLKILLT
jgi:DnaJ-class molecular chaperone